MYADKDNEHFVLNVKAAMSQRSICFVYVNQMFDYGPAGIMAKFVFNHIVWTLYKG